MLSGVLFILVLTWLPEIVAAQASTATPLYAQDSSDVEELPPLTTAQQEARALATVLIGQKGSATTPPPIPATPLELFSEQVLRPGKRLVVILGTWQGGQVRLVSGQQTFVSPIDATLPILTKHRLPPLEPGEDTAVAIEVLAE
jgi:hypothetical protein